MTYKLIVNEIPIGFFETRYDAQQALQYVDSGMILEE